MKGIRQLLWTVVFLADRGADEPGGLGLALLVVLAIVVAGWVLLHR
jgi:hypothetical protein